MTIMTERLGAVLSVVVVTTSIFVLKRKFIDFFQMF